MSVDVSTLLKTVATGCPQPQFIISTKHIANVEPALIQQLLLQNTLVGCNSLLVTSADSLVAMPTQTINCMAASVKAEIDTDSKEATEVCASDDKITDYTYCKTLNVSVPFILQISRAKQNREIKVHECQLQAKI